MRPPACAVCGEDFAPTMGRLVAFAERESDRQWRERASETAMVGHPPNVEWFCAVHAEAAEALAGASIDEAMQQLAPPAPTPPGPAPPTPAPPRQGKRPKREVSHVPIEPREVDEVVDLFRDRMTVLVGDSGAVATTTTKRTWSPMDGAHPPNCPFEDVDTTTVSGPRGEAELTWDRAMWNEDDPARRSVTLALTPTGGERCAVGVTVGAGFPGSEGSAATELLVIGQPGAQMQALIDGLTAADPAERERH